MTGLTKETIINHLESKEEFPISLSDVWEWLGYSKKSHALRGFKRVDFVENVDYLVLPRSGQNSESVDHEVLLRSQQNSESVDYVRVIQLDNLKSGRPEEDILMSLDTFKMWAMTVKTDKGSEVRRYFIQVEKEWKKAKLDVLNSPDSLALDRLTSQLALEFEKNVYRPWRTTNVEADQKFRKLVSLPKESVKVLTSEANISTSTPMTPNVESLMSLVDSLSLAANRAGLAGNKATVEGRFLSEQLDRIRSEFVLIQSENDQLKSKVVSLKNEIKILRLDFDSIVTDIQRAAKEGVRLTLQKLLRGDFKGKY